MKQIHFILLSLICLLTACNRHSEEAPQTLLHIVSEIEPQSTLVDWGNMTPEERQKYPRKGFVINSVADFPNDPNINMADLKLMNIDFDRYTLLANYCLIPGYIKSHRIFWFYNNVEDNYVFQTSLNIISTDDNANEEYDLFTYYRTAIIVDKIKPDKDVTFTLGY